MDKKKESYSSFSGEELSSLLKKARDKDLSSYEELSYKVREIAFSYFKSKFYLKKLPSIDDAEDLANNVYLAFAEQYTKIEFIENWLRRVLFFTYTNRYKSDHRRQFFTLDDDINLGNQPNQEERTEATRILEIANKLSEDKQEIIRLRFWEKMKFTEIAETMGKKEPAVKKMFYRALDEIKSKLVLIVTFISTLLLIR